MSKAKLLALFLASVLLLSALFGCSAERTEAPTKRPSATTPRPTDAPSEPSAPPENKAVIGSITALTGDFRWSDFSSAGLSAADADINALTNGHSLLTVTSAGETIWDGTVVRSHTEEEIDGNLVITIELFEDLRFSDGSSIKAENYLAYLLAFSSPVAVSAGADATAGKSLLGYDQFLSYNGLNDGKASVRYDSDGNRLTFVASKVFSGVRLLGEYSFSLTVSGADGYYPSYFAKNCAFLYPYKLEQVLGEGVTVSDDGNGVYLDSAWYEKNSDGVYERASHLTSARYDLTYAFSGAYTISLWNAEAKECTLTLNPFYKGTYDSRKPTIETLVYTGLVEETLFDALDLGVVDIVTGISGKEDCSEALARVRASGGALSEVYYLSDEHYRLSFNCSFGPAYFSSFRQALAYAIDTEALTAELLGDFGEESVAPFSDELYLKGLISSSLELKEYPVSLNNARNTLIADGWIYNADGSAYNESVGGLRYRKLTPEEAALCEGANLSYVVVSNDAELSYSTTSVEEEYYLPCTIAIRSDGSELYSVLASLLSQVDLLGEIGMSVCFADAFNDSTICAGIGYSAFESTPSPDGKGGLLDIYDISFPYTDGGLSYVEAMERSGGRLGLDYLSKAMIADADSPEEHAKWWGEYMERLTELLPHIALSSPYVLSVHSAKIKGLSLTPYRSVAQAIIYCKVG